ncbi:tetratricopeptide repeat protein [Helicobacter felistomachi]|uniref:tetratricopeptide repeat protein n=1 Tax=Helicobacter felistomachi TaxID=3040201 RepID=UPI002574189D|nr:hypothetical protein [Helicobacter sp. NHP21005]
MGLAAGQKSSSTDGAIFSALEAALDSLAHLKTPQKSDALKALEQTLEFLDSKHATELQRNNVCVYLVDLEGGLKTLLQEAKQLQSDISKEEELSTTSVEKAQGRAQNTLKNLLELLNPDTAKELAALSAEWAALHGYFTTQEQTYNQEQKHQEANLESQALENVLKTLKEGFKQKLLEGLEQLEAKISKLNTALDNFKASQFFKALIKPLWFYQGDNFKAYEDYLQASKKDNPEALLELGKMTLKGVVVVPSVEKAREHFKKAANLGSIRAVTELGLSYLGANGINKQDAKEAFDYLAKVLVLGDMKAYVGLEKLRHFEEFGHEMDTLNDALLKDAMKPCKAGHWFGFDSYIKDPSGADYDAWLALQEVQGECAYHHHFYEDAHIDKEYGIDPDYRESYIESYFEDFFESGVCATMQGHNARLNLSILKTIEKVYGTPNKKDYQEAYENAKEAYLWGIALGSGRCALELAYLELEQPTHFNLSPNKAQNALLETNHRAIGYFKKALELGYNVALVPLANTLGKQKALLAKAPKHPLNALLAKYESDAKELASLAPKFIDKSMGFGGPLGVKEHFTPAFWQHQDLENKEQVKEKASNTKPLWQYGNNTKQAFKDYMEAKEKGDGKAWLYLGAMSLVGVVVPPDPVGAAACFERAKELGVLQAHYGLRLVQTPLEYSPYGQGDYKNPLKAVEIQEGLERIFPLDPNGKALETPKDTLESWIFEEGEMRGKWIAYDDEEESYEQDEFETILSCMRDQANKGDTPMYAFEGLLRMEVGTRESHTWGLPYLKPREQKNLLRCQANKSYEAITQAIKAGYVDGYYLLAQGVHGLRGFYNSLEVLRTKIINETGNDEFDGEIYGGEEDYLEGLAPDDPKDTGKAFYAKKRKESLEAGTKAGSALCAVSLVGLLEKEQAGLKTDTLLEKRDEWIALLKPFWEGQQHYQALNKIIELLEGQIEDCNDAKEQQGYQESLDVYLAHLDKVGCDGETMAAMYSEVSEWLIF